MTQTAQELSPDDTLFVSRPKRVLQSRELGDDGSPCLNIHYGEIVISFDDPEFIPFGERLLERTRFRAGEAQEWVASLDAWQKVKPVLATLVDQGYLEVDRGGCPVQHAPKRPAATPPVESAAGRARVARTFDPEHCRELSRELFNLDIDASNIECVMRAIRLAHSALDETGRQLGDENTYPPELQLHVDTEYRVCRYAGSRNQEERPMNVTALELVTSVWDDVMNILHATKRELIRRRGSSDPLSLVEICVYATVVLSLPSYQLHRPLQRVKNGHITKAMSAVYRAIDGTRLTSRSMMHSGPRVKPGHAVPSLDEFLLHAETELLFFTPTRVCAGPPGLVRELVESAIGPHFDPSRAAVPIAGLADLGAAFDYALLGCELEGWRDAYFIWQGELIDAFIGRIEALGQSDTLGSLLQRLAAIRAGNSRHLGRALIIAASARPHVIDSMLAMIATCRLWRGERSEARRFLASAAGPDERPLDGARFPAEVAEAISRFSRALAELDAVVFPQMQETQRQINALLQRAPGSAPLGPAEYARAWPDSCANAVLSTWLAGDAVSHATATSSAVPASQPPTPLRSAISSLSEPQLSERQLLEPELSERRLPEPQLSERQLPEPQLLAEAEMATLRGLFARTRYSLPTALWQLAGNRSFDTELEAARSFSEAMRAARGATRPSESALEVLARLFLLGESVPEADLRWLTAAEAAALRASGLLQDAADGQRVGSPFAVGCVQGLYFATDNEATIAAESRRLRRGPNALVMPAYNETHYFAAKVDRSPADTAADLCTGSGVHALLASRHCGHVTGVDISARAVRFAEWNRRLNGMRNVSFVCGDLWAPLGDARFQRITVNPPYQPDSSAQPGENWWGAGPRGDAIIGAILQRLPHHLTEGGSFQMVGEFPSWRDRSFEAFVRAQLGLANASVALDTSERSLAAYRARYPNEALGALTRVEYGVVNVSR